MYDSCINRQQWELYFLLGQRGSCHWPGGLGVKYLPDQSPIHSLTERALSRKTETYARSSNANCWNAYVFHFEKWYNQLLNCVLNQWSAGTVMSCIQWKYVHTWGHKFMSSCVYIACVKYIPDLNQLNIAMSMKHLTGNSILIVINWHWTLNIYLKAKSS